MLQELNTNLFSRKTENKKDSLESSIYRMVDSLLTQLEIRAYDDDLRCMGLTEEEIEGNHNFMDWKIKYDGKH